MPVDTIFLIVILIISVVIHEVSHGYIANMLGDPTAKLAGRLTLNPVPHIDPLGSIILPGILALSGSPLLFGWAKPVPVNFYNLKNQYWGPALVGAAGALANLFIALIFGLMIRFSSELGVTSESFISISSTIVLLNILLAVFNLLPIPPLDGSKVLFAFLPHRLRYIETFLTQYWIVFIFLLLFFGLQYLYPAIRFIFYLITGS